MEGCCAWIGRLATNSPPIQRHGHSRGFAYFVLHPFSFTGKHAQAGTTHRRPASACLPFSFLICSCKALLLQTHSLSSAGTYMRHTQWNTRVFSTRSMPYVSTGGSLITPRVRNCCHLSDLCCCVRSEGEGFNGSTRPGNWVMAEKEGIQNIRCQ